MFLPPDGHIRYSPCFIHTQNIALRAAYGLAKWPTQLSAMFHSNRLLWMTNWHVVTFHLCVRVGIRPWLESQQPFGTRLFAADDRRLYDRRAGLLSGVRRVWEENNCLLRLGGGYEHSYRSDLQLWRANLSIFHSFYPISQHICTFGYSWYAEIEDEKNERLKCQNKTRTTSRSSHKERNSSPI